MKTEQPGLLCPRCGSRLPRDSIFCQFCGATLGNLPYRTIGKEPRPKRMRKKRTVSKRCKRIWASVLILAIVSGAVLAYSTITYDHAAKALTTWEYQTALAQFQKIPFAKRLFPDRYALAECGVLWDESRHEEAANIFAEIDLSKFPEDLAEQWKNQIYWQGVEAYANHWIGMADACFSALHGYSNSADYLYLIACTRTDLRALSPSSAQTMYTRLTAILDLGDAKSILLSAHELAAQFLEGRWKTHPTWKDEPSYSFALADRGRWCSYDLPGPALTELFYIRNGILSMIDEDGRVRNLFQFTISNHNTIRVLCYEDWNTYTLYRQ